MKLLRILNKLTQNQIPKRFMMNGGDKNFDGIPLREVTEKLTEFAPTTLAESWDNVGLLVEPCRNQLVKRILLTNDLTEDVMDEAIEVSANLIISYHPPLFAPLKKITRATWKERIVSLCLANNISIYSPHTSWDVVQGGVNDWLASAFDFSEIKPLVIQKPDVSKSTYTLILESTDSDLPNSLLGKYASDNDFKILMSEKSSNDAKTKLTIQCSNTVLQKVVPLLQESSNVTCFYVNPQHTVGEVVSGIGRMCKLKNKITIKEAVEKLKQHLNLPSVQLALARKATLDEEIKTIAVVAGSGGSLLKNIYCDLKITGEASHHEVLDSIHNGASVILTNHSNSERGFLLKFKEILASILNNPNVSIIVSSTDTDPLKVY